MKHATRTRIPAQIELPITGSIGQLPAATLRCSAIGRYIRRARQLIRLEGCHARQFNDQVRAVARKVWWPAGSVAGDRSRCCRPPAEWTVLDFACGRWSLQSSIYDPRPPSRSNDFWPTATPAVVADTAERAVQVRIGDRGPRHLGHHRRGLFGTLAEDGRGHPR